MKKLFVLLVSFFAFHGVISAQYNEIGVFVGGANVVSDIGKAAYINPNKLAYGLLYKRNLNNHLSARADLKLLTLWDNDRLSNIEARKRRMFAFENSVSEISVGVEYHFLEFDVHKIFETLFTPYIYSGITYFRSDALVFANPQLNLEHAIAPSEKRDGNWALPFALGVKVRFGQSRFFMGAEVGMRYTFTNNLDGSYSENPQLRFANLQNNDWYFVSGIYLTYTFGQKCCYGF